MVSGSLRPSRSLSLWRHRMPETNLGLRYPASTDTPDVPRDIGYLAADVNENEILLLMGAWG